MFSPFNFVINILSMDNCKVFFGGGGGLRHLSNFTIPISKIWNFQGGSAGTPAPISAHELRLQIQKYNYIYTEKSLTIYIYRASLFLKKKLL